MVGRASLTAFFFFLLWVQEITELPDYNKISFKEQAPVPLEEVLPDASPQALDLLGQFLLYPPRQRIAASQVGLKVIVSDTLCSVAMGPCQVSDS